MQLGISTYTYGWAVGAPGNRPVKSMSELDLLSKAESLGIRLVQFGDNLPLHELVEDKLQALYSQSKEKTIKLEIGARGLTENNLFRYSMLAEKLNAGILRFVIDAPDYEPAVVEVVDIIKNVLPLLEKANITLGIENHDRLKARQFARIIDKVGSKQVGICLDSVNSMGAGEGLKEIVDILAPYTVNLHVKDFGIQRLPHQMGFQIDGRPAGKGMLAVPWLLEKLLPYNRCQTAILEQWVVPEADIISTIQKEEAWAIESIEYLKPFFES